MSKFKSMNYRNKQSGLSLVELMIVLAIMVLLAVGIASSYDSSRSRAQAMITMASELGAGFERAKTDTGCYLNRPDGLFDKAVGVASANNYCSRDFSKVWNGPYVTRFPANASGEATYDKVGADVTMTINRAAEGLGKRYWIEVKNVPVDVIKQAMLECNSNENTDPTTINFDKYKCKAAVGTGETGTFMYMFSETR